MLILMFDRNNITLYLVKPWQFLTVKEILYKLQLWHSSFLKPGSWKILALPLFTLHLLHEKSKNLSLFLVFFNNFMNITLPFIIFYLNCLFPPILPHFSLYLLFVMSLELLFPIFETIAYSDRQINSLHRLRKIRKLWKPPCCILLHL